jgi:hypothetical protein
MGLANLISFLKPVAVSVILQSFADEALRRLRIAHHHHRLLAACPLLGIHREFRPGAFTQGFYDSSAPNTALHQFSAFCRFPIARKKRDR